MFPFFKDIIKSRRKSSRYYEPRVIQVIPKEEKTNHLEKFYLLPTKLETIKEEESEKTLKSFMCRDSSILISIFFSETFS